MRKKVKFIIPSLITLIILLIIFYIQGLYPFTDNSIVQVDADYQYIPVLYRIYDFLHGNGNIIYDDIGLGNNIYISMIIQGSIFSPLSLLLYFTSRDNLVNYFNIIVIVKVCLISLTTYIYINKEYKVNEYYKIVFSILYAFSGWVILNYFNIMWLDCLILFPLIIMFLNELFRKEKYLGYVITLSMSLMISYYMSYFILLFIIFYSFIYIFLKLEKVKVKRVIFKLGISTLVAILISSVSLFPALYQTFLSSRLDSAYKRGFIHNFMNKSLYLMMSSVFLVIFTGLLFKYKKDKKNIYIYVLLLILFIIGLFVEPINLGLHMGSYWSFPYRYSFITLFILMCGSLYYIEKFDFKGYRDYQVIRIILFVLFGILLFSINNLYYHDIIDSQIILDFDDFDVYKKILLIFFIVIIMIVLSLSFKNHKLRYLFFSSVCLLQIFIYSGWGMYYNSGYFLSDRANMAVNELDMVNSELERYKKGYQSYTPDYAFVYKVNTLDNWLHILPSKQIDLYKRLGYKNSDTCVRSYGGTIFSDWLFNVGYLIDDKLYKDESMYKYLDRYFSYYLYEYNYNNGFGLIYNKVNELGNDYDKYLFGFDLQNKMYKDLFNSDFDFIKISNNKYNVDDSGIVYKIEDLGFLYIDFYNDEVDKVVEYIKVNDQYINYDSTNYIIDLGMYDSDVKIDLGGLIYDDIEFDIGFIRYDDIMELNSNVNVIDKINNGYKLSVNNDRENGYLFLPINNISGLRAYINGNKVEIDSYMDNFVNIKLYKGNNDIEIKYEMPMLKLGIFLSIFGIICLLFFNRIPEYKIILNIIYYVYIFICIFVYLYFYGYSLFKYFG